MAMYADDAHLWIINKGENMKKGTLVFKELPKREQPLTINDLDDIFGGCETIGYACGDHKDCCMKILCWANMCVA